METPLGSYIEDMSGLLIRLSLDPVLEVEEALFRCWRRGSTVFLAGNGGSAATASHFACDLAKGTEPGSLPPFRVLALTDNVPLITAWGNDSAYEQIFARQLAPLVREDDLLMLISASGKSPNILAAARAARAAGAYTVALTGRTGGDIARLVDITVRVPADAPEAVEDAHSVITHALCLALRNRLQIEANPTE